MLSTSRLNFRPATLADAHLLYDLNLDPVVVRYTGDGSFKTVFEAQQVIQEKMFLQYQKYKMGRYLAFLQDGSFIGWCGLKYHPETNEVDLGYRFKQKYWGQGFATESSRLFLDQGFHTLGLDRIMATVMPANVASIKVLQKLGMAFKGHRKDPCDSIGMLVYDIKKNEYQP